ncbi:MAG: ribosome maturation factor RimM [Symbiobacterium sp.]|uniref:ribosome maturation factor RimM n=1 Tax=Symbiobacterium sp. TaxID=1971213 RepID=UPI003463D162
MVERSRPELIRIGQVTAPHGVRGAVRVYPVTDFPERFTTLRRVLLGGPDRPAAVKFRGFVKNLVILEIEGVTDRNQAEKLRGVNLLVPRSEVYPLPEGYYYDFDIIGIDVVDTQGSFLGRVVEVDHNIPVHDVYVVETAPGKRYMVPAVRQFIKEVDLEAGRMVIDPIPGLLED